MTTIPIRFTGYWTGKKTEEEQMKYVMDLIISGQKDQTTRKPSPNYIHLKAGDGLHLIWGKRGTPGEPILITECIGKQWIRIDSESKRIYALGKDPDSMGVPFTPEQVTHFAKRDINDTPERFFELFESGTYIVVKWPRPGQIWSATVPLNLD